LHANRDRRVRGIGEPIVSAQDPAKLAECHRHEALLNIAFADPAFWLLCPYDITALGGDVLEQARRTHPMVIENGRSQSSADFAGYEALCEPCRDPLPDPPQGVTSLTFEHGDLSDIRMYVAAIAAKAGMQQHRIDDLVLAANEIATNSLRHGGSRGSIRAWDEPGSMICEISDNGLIWNPLTGRLRPSVHRGGGRGLWLANQVCDLVQIRSLESGNVVRLHVRCS
jgi:anti-sigma regulatory factor (Ser/Thr protein kinase)